MSTADRDDLAAIVAQATDCMDCEGTGKDVVRFDKDMNPVEWGTCHRCGAVASMVLESDWLRDVKAEAWDECIKPFRHYGFTNRNPYRADRVDAEDTDNTTERTYKIPD